MEYIIVSLILGGIISACVGFKYAIAIITSIVLFIILRREE